MVSHLKTIPCTFFKTWQQESYKCQCSCFLTHLIAFSCWPKFCCLQNAVYCKMASTILSLNQVKIIKKKKTQGPKTEMDTYNYLKAWLMVVKKKKTQQNSLTCQWMCRNFIELNGCQHANAPKDGSSTALDYFPPLTPTQPQLSCVIKNNLMSDCCL